MDEINKVKKSKIINPATEIAGNLLITTCSFLFQQKGTTTIKHPSIDLQSRKNLLTDIYRIIVSQNAAIDHYHHYYCPIFRFFYCHTTNCLIIKIKQNQTKTKSDPKRTNFQSRIELAYFFQHFDLLTFIITFHNNLSEKKSEREGALIVYISLKTYF